MLCDVCKKNEATIHIKEIHNGSVHTSNLCAECAAKQEAEGSLGAYGFNLAEVLFNIGKSIEKAAENGSIPIPGQCGGTKKTKSNPEDPASQLTCPGCGWNLLKLRDSGGRLGCPDCYRTFAPLIKEALEKVQNGMVHVGKRPKHAPGGTAAIEFELKKAKLELEKLIRSEDYEAAAVCRDRITALKEQLAGRRSGEEIQHDQ